MNTSEVLNKAADVLEERGWAKGGSNGAWHPKAGSCGPVCLEGALRVAGGEIMHGTDYYEAVVDYLTTTRPEHINPNWRDGKVIPFSWNDHPRTEAHEVVEVLRAAALIEAAKENAAAEVSERVSA